MAFTIEKEDNRARAGILHSGHGDLKTPYYMPVATKGAMKDLTPRELEECKIQSIISNGFILSLRPTGELLAQHGGLHNFMKWNKGIFTDSGGFQILSDTFLVKKTPEGITFKNPYTGQNKLFKPEDSIHQQHLIGSDVAMALDDVPKYGVTKEEVEECLYRSHEWLKRNIEAHKIKEDKTNPKQMLFGIAQGGVHEDLRKISAEMLIKEDIDGFAMGGLAIGEPPAKMFHAIEIQTEIFQKVKDKPRYVMGLGSPNDMLEAVKLGCDMFDSIFPTQNARRGSLFTKNGTLRITNTKYREDQTPIDDSCDCYTCKNFTRSYVYHTLKNGERMGLKLASIHNIYFVQNLMANAREAIIEGKFEEFHKEFKDNYKV